MPLPIFNFTSLPFEYNFEMIDSEIHTFTCRASCIQNKKARMKYIKLLYEGMINGVNYFDSAREYNKQEWLD